jgi:hypothetical protein
VAGLSIKWRVIISVVREEKHGIFKIEVGELTQTEEEQLHLQV